MSIIDKAVAAVTPPEREQARAEARAKARSRYMGYATASANCAVG